MQRAERVEDFLPGIVQAGVRNLALPGQDLPEAEVGLQHPQGIRSCEAIGNLIQTFGDGEKSRDGFVVQRVEFRKHRILVAEERKLFGQQASRGNIELLAGSAPAVDLRQHQEVVDRPLGHRIPGNTNHPFDHLFRIVPAPGLLAPFTNELGIRFAAQDVLPDIDIAGDMRLAVGINLQPRLEQKEARVRPEGMLGRDWRDVVSAKRIVKTLQAARRGEIGLLRLAYAGTAYRNTLPASRYPWSEAGKQNRLETADWLPPDPSRRFPTPVHPERGLFRTEH